MPGPGRMVGVVLLVFGLAIGLAEIYALARQRSDAPWLAAAEVNALLTLLVIVASRKQLPWLRDPKPIYSPATRHPWLLYVPALAVLLGSLILVWISTHLLPGTPQHRPTFPPEQFAFIFLIPWLEEVVFRRGFGNGLRQLGGLWWGSYFSALLFSLVHSWPTLAKVGSLQFGVPLGPLFLGLLCEGIYCAGGRLGPAIALHCVCNLTVVIFMMGDERILRWLDFLYI